MVAVTGQGNAEQVSRVEMAIAGIDILALRTNSLGNWSYLLFSDGDAVVIDAQRDVDTYVHEAKRRKARIRLAIETHVHSDYVSGARALAQLSGARVVAPALGGYEFGHRAVGEGDEFSIGAVTLTCAETPGHTLDHVAWRLSSGSRRESRAVFTGGSLIAGGAGRTDLFGASHTRLLTQHQFRSLQTLAALPRDAVVLPTHGAGSTCSAAQAAFGRFTTIGDELDSNAYLRALSAEQLDDRFASTRSPAPIYFRNVGGLNRIGVSGPRRPAKPAELSPEQLAAAMSDGVAVVDARDRWSFADGHIPGSYSIEPHDSFASYVGSVVPFGRELALVVNEEDRALVGELVDATFRIGYTVLGVLTPGIDAWQAAGLPIESYAATDILELIKEAEEGTTQPILDVRDPSEWRDGALPGSTTISLRALPSRASDLRAMSEANPGQPLAIVCRGGARAAVAASLIAQLGIPVRPVLGGGIPDALAALAH